jgi:mannan endo-1,4-beta-mannosidase
MSLATPVDKMLTPETAALYQHLLTLMQQKNILLGQQDATAYGVGWKSVANQSDMKLVSGTHPALYGWDLGKIETGSPKNLDGVDFKEMRRLIREAHERGGVNTISWHVINPVSNQSSWDMKTMTSIDSLLPGAKYHEKYKGYLCNLAQFLSSLKTTDGKYIPIIFRPFHEHSGDWFWWSIARNTPDSYIALWRFTVSYLRDTLKLHHLLYAYSPDKFESDSDYFNGYPGDDYVDVLGLDYYHFGGKETAPTYVSDVRKMLLYITEQAKMRNKPAAFTETGLETVSQDDWWTGALNNAIRDIPIAWVLLWRNAFERPNHFYGPTPNHPANTDFQKFILNQNIITGTKLPIK